MWATLARSALNLLAWAYSSRPTMKRGLTESAWATMALMLSGMRTLKATPKNAQAASQPSITAAKVWQNVSHTNMCREHTAVNINACTTRRRAGYRIKQHPHPGEVDLTFHSRLTVDRRYVPLRRRPQILGGFLAVAAHSANAPS